MLAFLAMEVSTCNTLCMAAWSKVYALRQQRMRWFVLQRRLDLTMGGIAGSSRY